jgi:hypothetical protein
LFTGEDFFALVIPTIGNSCEVFFAHGVSINTRKMARPEGFEPPTNGFGSHYSIRLSYGRVVWSALAWAIAGMRASGGREV